MITDYIITPYTILIDTREQHPFEFLGLKSDAKEGYTPVVAQIRNVALSAGDYSIEGHTSQIAIERKSKPDFFCTFLTDRKRGENQLQKLSQIKHAFVVIECDWTDILFCNDQTNVQKYHHNPKSLFRSVIAWQQRFPRIHWWFCHGRDMAQTVTFRILERYWKDSQRAQNKKTA